MTDEQADRVVVLRGLPARTPRGWRPRGPMLTLGGLALLLQRIIAWSVAGAAHLLLAALLLALVREAARPGEDGLVSVAVWKGPAGERGDDVAPAPAALVPEPAEEIPPAPEPTLPEPVEDLGFLPATPVVPPPPRADPVAVPAEDPPPASIGGGASAAGAPAPGPAASAVAAADIDRNPTGSLKRRRAGDLARLQGGRPEAVVVVSGAYDDVEGVLDRLGIPYVRTEPERFSDLDLSACGVLLINCHTGYQEGMFKLGDPKDLQRQLLFLVELEADLQARLRSTQDKKKAYQYGLELLKAGSQLAALRSQQALLAGSRGFVERLRRFGESGGYVFTSDWGLTLLDRAFPGYLENGGFVGPLTTEIRARKGQESHPLLREAFPETRTKVLWEVDGLSYRLKAGRPSAVEILVEGVAGARALPVAAAFRVGKTPGRQGRVLHVLSHFKKQASATGDYALQNLLLNFMLDRFEPAEPVTPSR
jgi:hypothetical protein